MRWQSPACPTLCCIYIVCGACSTRIAHSTSSVAGSFLDQEEDAAHDKALVEMSMLTRDCVGVVREIVDCSLLQAGRGYVSASLVHVE